MLIESQVPKELWTYAVQTAFLVRNRCFNKQTPYFMLTGRWPNLARMQKFGLVCYAHSQNKQKLDSRSDKGIFIGYYKNSPAYLVYFPSSGKVQKHRLVKCVTPTVESKRHRQKCLLMMILRCWGGLTGPDRLTLSYRQDRYKSNGWRHGITTCKQNIYPDHTTRGKESSGGRWVYTLKTNVNGSYKFKACYVAKGYSQKQGVDAWWEFFAFRKPDEYTGIKAKSKPRELHFTSDGCQNCLLACTNRSWHL